LFDKKKPSGILFLSDKNSNREDLEMMGTFIRGKDFVQNIRDSHRHMLDMFKSCNGDHEALKSVCWGRMEGLETAVNFAGFPDVMIELAKIRHNETGE
jgi:hypothetical protein